ncbi:hypothetical protein EVJ58_g536 [Rhodofomes roseus]|uniref:Uncharacterized protein n=1 Tax=Rhodofomes roseus TaxID=34475 RepID=A0A4Y9Z5U5_9APHY|nr:hypothetical protein EVJ58_g536 [Rhodofomes roseus]
MSSQRDDQASQERRTRAANAFAHPGLPDIDTKSKRRNKQEMAEARAAQIAADEAAEEARTAAIQSIATVQRNMQQRDMQEQTQRTVPPRLAAKENRSVGGRNGQKAAVVQKSTTQTDMVVGVPAPVNNSNTSDAESLDSQAVTPRAVLPLPDPIPVLNVSARKRKSAPDTSVSESTSVGGTKKAKPLHPSGMLTSWQATSTLVVPPSQKPRVAPQAAAPATRTNDRQGASRIVQKHTPRPSTEDGYESSQAADNGPHDARRTAEGLVGADSDSDSGAEMVTVPPHDGRKGGLAADHAIGAFKGKGFVGMDSDFAAAAQAKKLRASSVASEATSLDHTPSPQAGSARQARRVPTNDDLPPGSKPTYNKVVVPKLINIIARLPNPWELQMINFAADVQRVWAEDCAHYPPGYVIEEGTPLYGLTMQRLYTWRSTFAANAITAVTKFWEDRGINDALDRAECAKLAVGTGKPFLFGQVEFLEDGCTVSKRLHRFEHPVILDVFSEHLRLVQAVPTPATYPRGALFLAAAAVERAWKLAVIGDGVIAPQRSDAFSEKSVAKAMLTLGKAVASLTTAKWEQILSRAQDVLAVKAASAKYIVLEGSSDDDDLYSDEESDTAAKTRTRASEITSD